MVSCGVYILGVYGGLLCNFAFFIVGSLLDSISESASNSRFFAVDGSCVVVALDVVSPVQSPPICVGLSNGRMICAQCLSLFSSVLINSSRCTYSSQSQRSVAMSGRSRSCIANHGLRLGVRVVGVRRCSSVRKNSTSFL